MEDYTNKYKGEQVEIALFGGEYQDGVLTAYCYLEDVAHVELNGHILIPLQRFGARLDTLEARADSLAPSSSGEGDKVSWHNQPRTTYLP